MKIAVIDFETHALEKPRPVEVGLVVYDHRSERNEPYGLGGTGGMTVTSSLVNPGVPIEPAASGVHLIRDEHVQNAMGLSGLSDWLTPRIGDVDLLVAHNASFDRPILYEHLTMRRPWLCTMRLAQRLYPEAPNHKLMALWHWRRLWETQPGQNDQLERAGAPHRARFDALACYMLLVDMWPALVEAVQARWGLMEPGHQLASRIQDLDRQPIELAKIVFGKHAGKGFADIPSDYLHWMTSKTFEPNNTDIQYTVRRELERRRR